MYEDRKTHLEIGSKPVEKPKTYRNPVKDAKAYQALLEQLGSRSALAEHLGVSLAQVTHVLNIVRLDEEIKAYIEAIEETDIRLKKLTHRKLRELSRLSPEEQKSQFWKWVR